MDFIENSVLSFSAIYFLISCIYWSYEALTALDLENKLAASKKKLKQFVSVVIICSVVPTIIITYVGINSKKLSAFNGLTLFQSIILTMGILFIIMFLILFLTFVFFLIITKIIEIKIKYFIELDYGDKWELIKTTSEGKYILKRSDKYKMIDDITSKIITKEIALSKIKRKIYGKWFNKIKYSLITIITILLFLNFIPNNNFKNYLIIPVVLLIYTLIILCVSKFVLKNTKLYN